MRLALKLATGAGKTTVMAMIITWQTVNAVRHPTRKQFTRGFLVCAPGLTIKDRLRVLVYATLAISCAPREARYVLSGILGNDTTLVIREHTSDTHRFTEHLFGLCALLGIALMPRLKDLPDQVLSRIDRAADYGPLQPLLRGTIDISIMAQ